MNDYMVMMTEVFKILHNYYILQELIRRWDSERELFNDDIAHT